MKRTILMTSALATAVFALSATAQEQAKPEAQHMSMVEIATLLESQGYAVHEIELEHKRYEVEMTDARGMRIEAYLNPVTGDVLTYDESDDDRYKNDD